ncbi:unnamed protein product [Rhodiola kirilowii]
MGNCLRSCRKSKSAVAADEDTRSQCSDAKTEQKATASNCISDEALYGSTTEVKIKMTKKELKEIFERVEQQGMPVGEVLAELLENRTASYGGGEGGFGGGEAEMRRQQSWRPMLQSIPEIDQLK